MSDKSVDIKSDQTLTVTKLYTYGSNKKIECEDIEVPYLRRLNNGKDRIKSFKSISASADDDWHEWNGFVITDCDDNIWCHGYNGNRNLGIGDVSRVTSWTHNDFFKKNNISIAKINAAVHSSRIYWITKNNKAYTTGGDGAFTPIKVEIDGYDDIIDIQPGHYFSVALCLSPTIPPDQFNKILFYWFRVANVNNDVEGLPDAIITLIIDYDTMGKVFRKGDWYKMIDNKEERVIIEKFEEIEGKDFENESIVSIACSSGSTFFVNNYGEIWALRDLKALGLDDDLREKYRYYARNHEPDKIPYFIENKIFVTKVSCGSYHTLVLDMNGKVHSWGDEQYAEVGRYGCYPKEPGLIEKLKDYVVVDIKAEGYNSYAKTEDDLHWVWGDNRWGQLKFEDDREEEYSRHDKADRNKYKQREPLMINDLFYEKIGKKVMIKDVCFGVTVMHIIASNKVQD